MPSLVYITRINQLSEELAGHLRSAGLQVQSFAPGEITADECLLAITPEAIKAGPHSANCLAPTPSQRVDAKLQATPQPPLPAVSAMRNGGLGFIPSDLGQRVFVSSAPNPASSPQSRGKILPSSGAAKSADSLLPPPPKKFRIAGAQVSALLLAHASLLKGGLRRRELWKPLAAAAVLLLFAIALLTNRTATAASPSDQATAVPSGFRRADSSSANSTQPAAPPSMRVMEDSSNPTPSRSSTNAPRASGRSHPSDNEFIAEDFTNHYDLRLRSAATQQTPDLQRNAQDNARPKRIVLN